MIRRLHLNGQSLGILPQTQNLYNSATGTEKLLSSFHLNGHALAF